METDTPKTSFPKRRWLILAASFCTLLLTGFGQYNAGVMKVALIHDWDTDVFTTTWLASYYAGCFAFTAPINSILINLTNCRACVLLSGVLCLVGYALSGLVTDVLYLFFTLTLTGIGQGMATAGSLIILGYYFPDKTNIVTGVCFAGGALGTFVQPPLLQALVDWYGLRGAFLLSGALASHSCVFGALMTPASVERRTSQRRQQGSVVQSACHVVNDICSGHMTVLTTRSVLGVLFSVFFMSLGVHVLLVQLPAYLIDHSGLTAPQAALSISVYGIGSFFSRIASGFIAHDPRIGNRLVYCGLMGVHTLVSLAAPPLLDKGIVGAYVYLFMVGLYSGGGFSLFTPVLYDVVSLHHFSTAFGMGMFVLGVGGLLGAPLSEQVYVDGQNPYILFGFVAALFFTSTVLGSTVTTTPTSQPPAQPPGSEDRTPDAGYGAVNQNNDSDQIPEHETMLISSLDEGSAGTNSSA